MKIVGVTACPTGIAHTYMAQENLTNECKSRGFECKFETQGGLGIENEVTEEEIEEADLVILGVSISIEGEERFEDKIVYQVDVGPCVSNPKAVVDDALKYYEGEV